MRTTTVTLKTGDTHVYTGEDYVNGLQQTGSVVISWDTIALHVSVAGSSALEEIATFSTDQVARVESVTA